MCPRGQIQLFGTRSDAVDLVGGSTVLTEGNNMTEIGVSHHWICAGLQK